MEDFLVDEEIERVDRHHVGDEVDGDVECVRRFFKYRAGLIVAERVLLPVQEVATRFNRLAIGDNRCARVRRGAETDRLWPQFDLSVVAVARAVREGDSDAHDDGRVARLTPESNPYQ